MSLDANALFKKLLRDLRPLFKENGFRSASQNFIFESEECWAIFNFQSSRWSSADEKTFYINVAVTPKRFLEFQGQDPSKAPAYYDCDWRWRAEQLGPDKEIKEWTIKDEHTAHDVLIYLQELLTEFVIPAAKALASERVLIEKAGTDPSYPQGKAVSVLLAANGRVEELAVIVGNMVELYGGGIVRENVRAHLEQLRNRYPEQMTQIER